MERARAGELLLEISGMQLPQHVRCRTSALSPIRGKHAAAEALPSFGSVLIRVTESKTSRPDTLLNGCGVERVVAGIRCRMPLPIDTDVLERFEERVALTYVLLPRALAA